MEGKKTFVRDGRAPIPTKIATSHIMSANRAKDTNPENILRKVLWANDIRGYRLHQKGLPGKPDIVFVSKKLAIFVNGCFWHRCPHCQLPLPKSNSDFWKNKFETNIARDERNSRLLKEMGWRILIIWECQITKALPACVKLIAKKVGK